jgi:hypothetical protein
MTKETDGARHAAIAHFFPGDDVAERAATLEAIVDAYGLAETLSALSIVCGEKAEHVETNWQDENLAAHWQDASNKLDKLAARYFQVTGLYK